MYSVEDGIREFDKQITWMCAKNAPDPLVRDFLKSKVVQSIRENRAHFNGHRGNFFEWAQAIGKNPGQKCNKPPEPVKKVFVKAVAIAPKKIMVNKRMKAILKLQSKI
jgi:hypothetical protein